MSVNGTFVEVKMCTFTLESTHFIFNECPIYTHDGASAKFSTYSHEMDYSEGENDVRLGRPCEAVGLPDAGVGEVYVAPGGLGLVIKLQRFLNLRYWSMGGET